MVLPQLEQSNLHTTINFGLPIAHAANQAARSTRVKEYLCPSDAWTDLVTPWPTSLGIRDLAPSSYVASLGGGDLPTRQVTQPCMKRAHLTACSIATARSDMLRSPTGLRTRSDLASGPVCSHRTAGLGLFLRLRQSFRQRLLRSAGKSSGKRFVQRSRWPRSTFVQAALTPDRQPRWILESAHRRLSVHAHGRFDPHDSDQRRHGCLSRDGRPQ